MNTNEYKGRRLGRTTPRSVRIAERTARGLIAAGGMGTIAAVFLIMAFLVWVVAPLFGSASLDEQPPTTTRPGSTTAKVVGVGTDDLQLMSWVLSRDGTIRLLELAGGAVIAESKLFPESTITAWSFNPDDSRAAFGFADGTLRSGTIDFESRFFEAAEMPEVLRGLSPGDTARHLDGMVRVTPGDQFHYQELKVDFGPAIVAGASEIRGLDFSVTNSGNAYAAIFTDGTLAVLQETVKLNMMTGDETVSLNTVPLPLRPTGNRGLPDFIQITGRGTNVFIAWQDGYVQRFDVVDRTNPRLAETHQLTDTGTRITAASFMIGKTTLLVGDSSGRTTAWFLTKPEDAGTLDGAIMEAGHVLDGPESPVTAFGPSRRSRLTAVGYESGEVRIFHVTTDQLLGTGNIGDQAIEAINLSPRENGTLAVSRGLVRLWSLDPGYPEVTLSSLFQKVWYEGYPQAEHAWQSTGGSDDFEPKLGLYPLIFGTLKATLYAIMIAAPLALLAAIYTSEFMEPRLRTTIKSTVEMMASLPSVVLGFLAALVIAPWVQHVLPTVLAAFATLPFSLLLGAKLWQLLPTRRAVLWSGWQRLLVVTLCVPIGLAAAAWLGPIVEALFFSGDLKRWLDGGIGSGTGGWQLLMLPLTAVVVVVVQTRTVGPWFQRVSRDWTRARCAIADLALFLTTALLVCSLSWFLGNLLGGMGLDPRGGILGTYSQRNALVVGFVMGFAVIPIIYTLAEDALSSVPGALREGSLGAGATPWQTTWRIVIPTAMSGLFGALMVGLGRAVGETMIVLMAAGNTPIMNWNVFSGFRTLSANIAVELPEAVRDSTHYRTLFLAALVLFALTFAINTFAEGVRRISRRRSADL